MASTNKVTVVFFFSENVSSGLQKVEAALCVYESWLLNAKIHLDQGWRTYNPQNVVGLPASIIPDHWQSWLDLTRVGSLTAPSFQQNLAKCHWEAHMQLLIGRKNHVPEIHVSIICP